MLQSPGLSQLRRRATDRKERLLDGQQRLGDLPASWTTEWNTHIDGWVQSIDQVVDEIDEPVQVYFTLLGGTGDGKSTLVNALLSHSLLPVGNIKACTAAICEIGYQPDHLTVSVEYVSQQSWHDEMSGFAQRLADRTIATTVDTEADSQSEPDRSDPVAQKIEAVYGTEQLVEFLNSGGRSKLSIPEPARTRFLGGQRVIPFPDVDTAKEEVRKLLSSSRSDEQGGQMWPLVQQVEILGPFDVLKCGARLVDLPGLNDPNAARDAVTRRYLEESSFVWVVYNMKRSVRKDMVDALKERDLFRRLVMEGRAGGLTMVGTAADDINPEADAEAAHLPSDADEVEIANARRGLSEREVRAQLRILADEVAAASGDTGTAAHATLTSTVDHIAIHSVSARDFLQLRGLFSIKRTQPLFDEVGTGIPSLASHLEQTVELNLGEQRTGRLTTYFDRIEADIRSRVTSFRAGLAMQRIPKEEVAAAAQRAATFLDAEFAKVTQQFVASIEISSAHFKDRLRVDAAQTGTILQQLERSWGYMRWNTLLACCRRGGQFSGNAGYYDLSSDVSNAVTSTMTLAFADFFGRQLIDLVRTAEHQAELAIANYRVQLAEEFAPLMPDDVSQRKVRDDASQDVARLLQSIVDEIGPTVSTQIKSTQVDLSRWIHDVIAKGMGAGYAAASDERGPGMQSRIVGTLTNQAKLVLSETMPQAQSTLETQVDNLARLLISKLHEAISAASQHAIAHGSTLSQRFEATHAASLDRLQRELEQLAPAEPTAA